MRLFVKAIIIFDILIILVGLFKIFDKIMRRKNRIPESHYTLRPFEKNSNRGYALYNDDDRYIYYAVKEGEADNCDIYYFKNSLTKNASEHKISEILRNNKAPNFSKKTFFFDNEEIWKYLSKKGFYIQGTIVDENTTQYKIKKDSNTIAFIRKRKGSGRVYTMRTYEKNIDLLFLVLFSIAKTDEKVIKKEPTEQKEPSA